MPDFPPHLFWDFSLSVYARPGVQAACLALQERHTLDVNILLFCLWSAAAGRAPLTDAEMCRLLTRAGEWHEAVVRPLRGVRRRMKHDTPGVQQDLLLAVRRALVAVEIDCEHIEQLVIVCAAGEEQPAAQAPDAKIAAGNIELYLRLRHVELDEKDENDLALLIAAAFPSTADVAGGGGAYVS